MARKHKEHSLFLRPAKEGKAFYHVKLWDAVARRYSVSRSTGETDYGAALLKVPGIQREILAEAERRDDPLLLDFLLDFWRSDSSYAQMKRLRGKPWSAKYVKNTRYIIERFILSLHHPLVRRERICPSKEHPGLFRPEAKLPEVQSALLH